MQLTLVIPLIFAATATCNPGDPVGNEFMPPLGLARRCPCPYINSLANHGFLNRDGFNVSVDQLLIGFDVAFNIDPAVTQMITNKVLPGTTSIAPNTLNLDDLDQHGLLEHDASLSRADIAVGDNSGFNATIWDSVAAHFTEPTISIETMELARQDRIAAARATNPTLDFSDMVDTVSKGETALTLMVFSGGGVDGGANTQQVNTLFREERIPFDQGYVAPAIRITGDTLGVVSQKLADASAPVVV